MDHHGQLLDALAESPLFTHVWVSDHLQEGERPVLEAWTRLSYLSGRYPRFAYGHFVLGQNYRNPALVAKMAATVAHLTDGRYLLGIGAGWLESEYRSYGYPFPAPADRLEQLEEAIHVVRAMWTGGPASFTGRHYRIDNAYCRPAPPRPIPIMIGTNGRRALRIVAKHADIWNWDAPVEAYAEPHARLMRECAAIGRNPREILLSAGTEVHLPDDPADFRPGEVRYGDPLVLGPRPRDVVDRLAPMVGMGVRHFQVYLDDLRSAERFRDEVAPRLADIADGD